MNICGELNLDMQVPGWLHAIHAKQGDVLTRSVKLNLFSGGAAWEVVAGLSPAVCYVKPDGTGGCYDTMPDGTTDAITYTVGTAFVLVKLAPQVLTAAGIVQCEIRLTTDGGEQLTSFRWLVDVEKSVTSDIVRSEDYYNLTSFNALSAKIGALSDLDTTDKSSIVAAVNEVLDCPARLWLVTAEMPAAAGGEITTQCYFRGTDDIARDVRPGDVVIGANGYAGFVMEIDAETTSVTLRSSGARYAAGEVPATRTVNGKPLSADVTVSAADVPVQVDIGDTQPESVHDALDALNTCKQAKAVTATVNIAVADWLNGRLGIVYCDKAVHGVTADSIVLCDSSDAAVSCTAQGAGTLTFTASATPTEEATVKVVLL